MENSALILKRYKEATDKTGEVARIADDLDITVKDVIKVLIDAKISYQSFVKHYGAAVKEATKELRTEAIAAASNTSKSLKQENEELKAEIDRMKALLDNAGDSESQGSEDYSQELEKYKNENISLINSEEKAWNKFNELQAKHKELEIKYSMTIENNSRLREQLERLEEENNDLANQHMAASGAESETDSQELVKTCK